MKFEEFENAEPIDELIREFLLDRNPQGLNGESLMEQAALGEMGRGPALTPSAGGREQEMIAKLRDLANEKAAAAVPAFSFAKIARWAIPAAAVTLLAIWFSTSSPELTPVSGITQTESPNQKENVVTANDITNDNTPVVVNADKPQTIRQLFFPNSNRNLDKNTALVNLPENKNLEKINNNDPFGFDNLSVNSTNEYLVSIPEQAKAFYENLSPGAIWFSLNNQTGATIQTAMGATLVIPSDCFVNQKGEVAKGPVQLRVVESRNISDLIRSGLSFYASGQYFANGGALYVEAIQYSQTLDIAPDKNIFAELPESFYATGNDFFAGKRDSEGRDWVRMTSKENSIVPLQPEDLYFHQFWCMDHRDQQWNDYLVEFSAPEYQNTFVATLQFRERLKAAWELGHNGSILSIYKNNLGLELWQADEKVAAYLKTETAMADFAPPYNGEKKFRQFALQGYGKVSPYDNLGFNPDMPGERAKLQAAITPEKFDELMRVHHLRKQYQTTLEHALLSDGKASVKSKKLRPAEETQTPASRKGIRLSHTGWVAVGAVLNATEVGQVEVTFSGNPKLEVLDVFYVNEGGTALTAADLIFSDNNHTTLSAPQLKAGGWVVVMGYDHGMPWLGMKQVTDIAETVMVDVVAVSFDQLKQDLKRLNN
jgi:hypothetical protein